MGYKVRPCLKKQNILLIQKNTKGDITISFSHLNTYLNIFTEVKNFKLFVCVHLHVCVNTHATAVVEAGGQLARVGLFLSPRGSWGWNLSHEAWWQNPLSNEPSKPQPTHILNNSFIEMTHITQFTHYSVQLRGS